MSLDIRLATPKDLQPLLSLFVEAAQYKIKHDDRSWRNGFSESGVSWMIGLGTAYTAYLDGTLVGTAALEWSDDAWDDDSGQAGYLHRLAVREGYHGQDLGVQILDWAADQVRLKGRTSLRLDCNTANTKLCVYYEKQGFALVGTKRFPEYETLTALYEKLIT